MPQYQDGDEKKYFATVIAALVIIAIAVATFIFSLVRSDKDDFLEFLVEDVNGVPHVSPGPGMPVPDGPPNIPPPTSPPLGTQ
jgi:hypothetical protein